MPTTRIKNKVSKLVTSQVPEFVQSNYGTFVTFLEKYYEYLEQDQQAQEIVQNALDYSDIDSTASTFIQYFLDQYAKGFPTDLGINKPFFIKNLNDLYESKGSELSFKTLFKLLYDENITLSFPYENVLIASDGVWEKRASIVVETLSGDPNELENRQVKYESNGAILASDVLSFRSLRANVTEIFLDATQILPPFAQGNAVFVGTQGNVLFSGNIQPVVVTANITTGGQDFSVGSVYEIVDTAEGIVGTTVKVTQVGTLGNIERVEFIKFGYGYPTDFIQTLYDELPVSQNTEPFTTISNGFIDSGDVYLSNSSLASYYFAEDYNEDVSYTGVIEQTFESNTHVQGSTTVITSLNPDVAQITFEIGSVARYPGQFLENRGFLSENDIRLQDDRLYQPFAYVINSSQEYDDFQGIVRKTVHPAGQEVYSNKLIENTINIAANVSVVSTRNIFTTTVDVVYVNDSNISKSITRPINNNISNVTPTETELTLVNFDYVYDYFAEEYVGTHYFII